MKAIMLVDYNEHIRKGDEAPANLAAKLVKVGLAKMQAEPKGKAKSKGDEEE